MQKVFSISGSVVKMALGLFFIISALSKYVGIDVFEVYIYSLKLLPLALSQVAARVVIVGELWLALLLISNRWHRFSMLCTTLLLLAFTLLLGWLAISGRTDSCHCMGELMPFNPTQSMLKNAVLLVLVFFAWRFARVDWQPRWWLVAPLVVLAVEMIVQFGYWGQLYVTRFMRTFIYVWMGVLTIVAVLLVSPCPGLKRWWVTALLALAPLVTIFILSAPDSWLPAEQQQPYDQNMLYRQMQGDGPLNDSHVLQGRRVVALYSSSCHYCQMAAEKIGTMQQRDALPDSLFVNVFPLAKRDGVSHSPMFYAASLSPHFYELNLPADTFLYITRGRFPLVLFMEDGKVQRVIDFRDISEKDLKQFLIR